MALSCISYIIVFIVSTVEDLVLNSSCTTMPTTVLRSSAFDTVFYINSYITSVEDLPPSFASCLSVSVYSNLTCVYLPDIINSVIAHAHISEI